MKKLITFVFITILTTYSSSCLLTNELYLKPVDSVSGTRAMEILAEAGMLSYFIGFELVDSKYNTYKNDYFLEKYLRALSHGLKILGIAGIQKDRYYKTSSVEACSEYIMIQGALLFKFFHEHWMSDSKSNDRVDTVGRAAAGYFTPIYAMDGCELEETGKVIHLGDTLNL